MGYAIEGALLEVCSCGAPCPCRVGEEARSGCDALLIYQYDRGEIEGVEVSGLAVALATSLTCNTIEGESSVTLHVDRRAAPAQREALIGAHTGRFGGPLADLAALIEVREVRDTPILIESGPGGTTIRVGEQILAEVPRQSSVLDRMLSRASTSPARVGGFRFAA